MLGALFRGFRAVARNWGLVVLVLAVNLGLALVLALPLASQLERELAHRGSSATMMYSFDYDWWNRWSEDQTGYTRSFAPDVFGAGFIFKNLDLLLGEHPLASVLPGDGLTPDRPRTVRLPPPPPVLDPLIMAAGVLYLLVQVFLTGGLLGVLRAPQGGWTFRGLIHGSGFYFGRLLRVSLLALGLVAIVFAVNAPLARWMDELAREAVSERTALAIGLGRHALLLGVLGVVHMVASFARVIVVREERRSAALALVSSLGFCARNLASALGQYAVVLFLALLLLVAWRAADSRLIVLGWRSQLLAFALFEALLLGRIGLRLGLLASQLELHRSRGR
jgi:hypothetical protein